MAEWIAQRAGYVAIAGDVAARSHMNRLHHSPHAFRMIAHNSSDTAKAPINPLARIGHFLDFVLHVAERCQDSKDGAIAHFH